MIAAWSIAAGLAAYRIYRLIARDSITEPFHGRINAASNSSRLAYWINELLNCPWCLGFWISTALAVVGYLLGHLDPVEAIIVALAASTVAGLASRVDVALEAITRASERSQTSRH